jgi:RNA polymerase sigma factor (sigma-70 family)
LCLAAETDKAARRTLFALIHAELRSIVGEGRGRFNVQGLRLMSASDLVQDASVRLLGWKLAGKGRRQFYWALGEAVRQSLIAQASDERQERAQLSADVLELVGDSSTALHDRLSPEDRLSLEDALEDLESVNPNAAEAFRLRHHVGLDRSTIAGIMDLSAGQIHRSLQDAREFLRHRLPSQEKDRA